ncbi:MAG: hypothetical protein LQ348_006922, partial [Seirophora lacunosa]
MSSPPDTLTVTRAIIMLLRIMLLESDLNLRQLLQLSFVLAASTVFALSSLPNLGSRYLDYGSRATSAHPEHETGVTKTATPNSPQSSSWYKESLEGLAKDDSRDAQRSANWLYQCLYFLEKLRVPHGWFLHFYLVSVACSIFWGVKIARRTDLVVKICENVQPGGKMSVNQVVMVWSLMTVQGARRLLECISLNTWSSSSRMWFVHWLLGIWFYVAMSFAVWIEAAETLLQSQSPVRDITFSAPSVRTMMSIPLFILASGVQHDCHTYLASLPKYTLPDHPIFHTMVCPHYTAESAIYLALAILGAPRGAWMNQTIATAFVFVAVNLAVTAAATKKWYMKKFGKEKVDYRWTMIPAPSVIYINPLTHSLLYLFPPGKNPNFFTLTTSLNVRLTLGFLVHLPPAPSNLPLHSSPSIPQFTTPPSPPCNPSSTSTSPIPCKHPAYISPVLTSKLPGSWQTLHAGRRPIACPGSGFAYTSSTMGAPRETVATTGAYAPPSSCALIPWPG